MRVCNFFIRLLICFTLCLPAQVLAREYINLTEMDQNQVDEKITELKEKLTQDDISPATKQDLNQTIELFDRYQKQRASYKKVKDSVDNHNKIIQEYRKLQKELETKFTKLNDLSIKAKKLSLEALYDQLALAKLEQSESQKKYNEQKNYLEMLYANTEFVQNKSLALQEEIERSKQLLNDHKSRPTEENYYELNIQLSKYTLDYYQFLNNSHAILQNIVSTILNYYKLKLDYDTQLTDIYQRQINLLLNEQSQQESIKINEELSEIIFDPSTSSKAGEYLVNQNTKYRTSIKSTSDDLTKFKQELGTITDILNQTNKIESTINSQIEHFKSSLYLSQILHKQLFDIPSYTTTFNTEDQITNIRFELYEVNSKLSSIQNKTRYESRLNRKYQEQLNEDQLKVIDQLLDYQKKLLDLYKNRLTEELTLLVNIKVKTDLYNNTKSNIKNTVNKQLFWLQSNAKMTWNWFKNFPSLAKRELADTNFSVNTKNLLDEGLKNITSLLTIFILSILILVNQKKFTAWINLSNKKATKLKTDTYSSVFVATFLTAVKSLNWPLWSLIFGYILSYLHLKIGIYDIGQIIKVNNFRLAGIIWVWAFSYSFYKENSIHKIHFKQEYHKETQWCHMLLLGLLVCLSLLCSCKLHYLETLPTDVIGQSIFITILLLIDIILIKYATIVFKEKQSVVKKLLALSYVLIPLILISRIYYGYFYSAIVITVRIIETYFFIFIMNFIYYIIRKSLKIAQYRFNMKRKFQEAQLKKNENSKRNGEDNIDENIIVPSEDELSIDDINKQTSSILKFCYFTVCLFLLHFMWSDIIGILSYLNTITLWNITATDAAGKISIIKSVSITDVVISIFCIVLMVIMVKNIPGLLEVTLNKFATTQNASYSTKTILTYIIIGVCLVISMGKLGVTWDNLQWLVAALSVGLGFGLQEIFGNFVSGLIILFERPIRLGDIVTIGDISGTVTKIRIRATTILQFDKKELIVPNKKFITESLTNWTLSDTMTRIEIKVGVGYSSDVELVQKTLLDIANECPYVMKDPAPKAYFISFGDSNLDHTLYVYIKTIAERYLALNYLNKTIFNKFNELNIEIAFNQIDMYIKNINSDQEIKIQTNSEKKQSS